MDQYLYKYLVLHKHLSIPELGNFAIENVIARYDEVSGLLQSPKPVISFTQERAALSEKLFFDFLAYELGVDELTAIKQFHDFSYRFRSELSENGSVILQGVGTLTKDADEKIFFIPTHDLSDLLPPVTPGIALPVADHQSTDIVETIEETESIETKDSWWMYAIILLILGLGALILYYT